MCASNFVHYREKKWKLACMCASAYIVLKPQRKISGILPNKLEKLNYSKLKHAKVNCAGKILRAS